MVELALLALATYRLTHLLVVEQGPRDVLETLRYLLRPHTGVLECPWCAGVWVAAGLALLLRLDPGTWALYALAGAAGGLVVWRWMHGEVKVPD